MKKYLIIDNEGWCSCSAFKTIDDAIEQAEHLLIMEDWKDATFFSIKELNTRTDIIHDIIRVYRNKEDEK